MTFLNIGDVIRFDQYKYQRAGVPAVFSSGDALVVIEVEQDGVVRCALADFDGLPLMKITDMLFVEELHTQTEAEVSI